MGIYLDNAATTRVHERVLTAMTPFFTEKYGNASSVHTMGSMAAEALAKSREKIASKIGAKPSEVIFTSGGTESNNFAIKGIAFTAKKGHIITTKIEHDCVLNAVRWLEKQGFTATYVAPDADGIVSPEAIEEAIREDTILISVMHANNEIGTLQPIREIGKIAEEHNIPFHTDACQSFTKEPLDVVADHCTLVSINAHKMYGPKGVGALIVREGTKITPLLHGGGHERGLRSGTENVAGIVGFAAATDVITEQDRVRMRSLRDKLISETLSRIPDTRLNGHPTKRLVNNANFSFKHIEGESLLLRLDSDGIYVSTGSACSSHTLEPSHVLMACGVPVDEAHSSVRMTLGIDTTSEEIDRVVSALESHVAALRKMSPFWRG